MVIGDASGSNNDSINGLDGGNPLHMNPNDSTSSSLIPFKLIGHENYRIWANAMKLSLQARNKFAFVNGTCVKSTYSTSEVLSAQWDRCNVVVLTWIMNFVSTDVYMVLVYSVDAVTVWKDFESTYDKSFDQDPLPKVKDAYVIVSKKESHRGIPESYSVTKAKLNATSFAAKSLNNLKEVITMSQSPYDEGRATSVVEGSPSFSKTDTEASQLSKNGTATQVEDTSLSEGNLVQYEPRRSSRVSKIPSKLNDYVIDGKLKYGLEKHVSYAKLNYVNYCFATTLNKSVEPTNYYEAATDPRWVEAMNNEIDALYRNHTWTIVNLSKGRKAIRNKWIYKIKYKASGEIEIYKARIVAKGFNQNEGFNYDETFSLIVNMVTVRCLIAVSNSWPLYQLDVNSAFLYGDLIEDVYRTLPLGFGDNNDNKVCKLNKSLYGFKQARRQWNAKLTTSLIEHGFVQTLRVLGYLKGALGTGVQFYKSSNLSLKAFSDAAGQNV
nr:ribonuclease H-like domain-containing protein [Tanacetum cinerariifolium]